MAPNNPASVPLDFEALLSRQYRPARLSHLVPQEAYRPIAKDAAGPDAKLEKSKRTEAKRDAEEEEKVLRLAMQLVSQTPEYTRHLKNATPLVTLSDSDLRHDSIPKPPQNEWDTLPAALHEVELGDWEKNINWEGYVKPDEKEEKKEPVRRDATSLLLERRNPHLDALVFDDSNVFWDATPEELAEKAKNVPLILDLGITGRSVAAQLLPTIRPKPFTQSEAFARRFERELSSPAVSTAGVSKSLHADPDQMEKIYKEKQERREQLAKDKSTRVTEAMGTLALGGGKGRTITSSLMGPGGTERTGRPSRNSASSLTHMEHVEQLEMVFNHSLVKPDLRKVELRQYHRPKLPRSVVRPNLPWQFKVRIEPSAKKKTDPNSSSSSYQSMMTGTHTGAMSQVTIRNEADLSPTEGNLVLVEYCEERPPIQLTKGMASKIVNYYRGDKTRCPVSAGGGDRPTRRKQHADVSQDSTKGVSAKEIERPPRLLGPNHEKNTSLIDWIGKPPKKAREDRSEKSSVNIIPEGVTEILHPKVHGPFIGEVEEGTTQTGLINNLFSAPLFQHEPESTDFLMILGQRPVMQSRIGGSQITLGVTLRSMPSSVFVAGQTEPRTKVFAPNTTGERNFVGPFICYQIAKVLTRTMEKDGQGLRLEEISDGVFANTALPPTALRQRIKQVAIYDKNTQIWTSKPIGMEEYPGVEALGRKFTPEGVAAYETECAAVRRLCDLGIHELYSGTNSVASVTMAMVYLTGQMNAARERKSKMSKMLEVARTSKSNTKTMVALYEKAASVLEAAWKEIKRRHDVARFIHEELQLSPWHITSEFIDVHKNAQGTAMMKLTGLGDPSGLGEGFNFLREVDSKPNKGSGNTDGALNAQIKKITGTENDLRKLNMGQMAQILRYWGMEQNKIDTLKRWDRVHVIRDLSTKAASDGLGDGLERFARGEKMKLSEQKQMYQARIQEIWRRQRAALSTESSSSTHGGATGTAAMDGDGTMTGNGQLEQSKQGDKDIEDSDSDFEFDIVENMKDDRQANQIVAAHVRGEGESDNLATGAGALGQQRREDTQELSKDARELAALKRQQEEERAARATMDSGMNPTEASLPMLGRKVIRRRVTKTHPDGRQTTSFKFICFDKEVETIIAKKKKEEAEEDARVLKSKKKASKSSHHRYDDKRTVGHAIFEDDDDIDYSRGRPSIKLVKRRVMKKGAGAFGARALPKSQRPVLGKLKPKHSHEKRIKKRKREAEEADLYVTASKRRGTSNRRERGSVRERMPHVILNDRLEVIRDMVEKRSDSGPFHRKVSPKQYPKYYEVISDPIALENIREKTQKYDYRTADAFLRDFDLMRNNAVKFNGKDSLLSRSADAIYDFTKNQIEHNRQELTEMEDAVKDQFSGRKKKGKGSSKSMPGAESAGVSENSAMIDGVAVNLGDVDFDGESDSDDSGEFTSFLNLT